MLLYQARSFSWTPFSQTLPDADADPAPDEVMDAVVVWLHVEAADEADEARVFRHTLKHTKWLANKRSLRTVALHSFTHLGATNASPAFARGFIEKLAERLRGTGYTVKTTPFGWFCGWSLDVYGDSLAKVYKAVEPKG